MFESTSTTAKSMSGFSSRSSCILGVRILHGSHHSAWKLTITALSALMTWNYENRSLILDDSRTFDDVDVTFLSKSKWSLITNRLGLHADNDSVFRSTDSVTKVVLLIAFNIIFVSKQILKIKLHVDYERCSLNAVNWVLWCFLRLFHLLCD